MQAISNLRHRDFEALSLPLPLFFYLFSLLHPRRRSNAEVYDKCSINAEYMSLAEIDAPGMAAVFDI